MKTLIIRTLGVIIMFATVSGANAEVAFLNDQNGITSHVLINGVVYPIENNGTVVINGKSYGYDELMMFSSPSKPAYATHQQPSRHTGNRYPAANQQSIEFDNTKYGIKHDLRREARKTLGYGFGSGIAVGIVDDVLGAMFR